ncbi:hypothetical protein G7Y89_g11837 [Cudoniella acicularis]|uniref:Uncharacterized protein n=1 Tax=Cudoniella acicularis TaxID=354080 RepID=A0A8H4VXI3_9HELO|nr:hypothetical protein G7Y89_g11837 [Cudoniella acicularis]
MAAEIQSYSSGSDISIPRNEGKEKDVIQFQTDNADIEDADFAGESKGLLQRADKTELTPVEAFKWDVSGDQSPFPEVAACVSNTDDPSIPCNSEYRARHFHSVFGPVRLGAIVSGRRPLNRILTTPQPPELGS